MRRQAAPQACGAGAVDGLPTPPPSMATNSREVVCWSHSVMADQFVDPVRHLVAERRRHDVLAVRATRHGIAPLCSAISAIAVSVSPISRKNCTIHPARHAARRPREEAPIRAAQECGRRGQDLRRCARPRWRAATALAPRRNDPGPPPSGPPRRRARLASGAPNDRGRECREYREASQHQRRSLSFFPAPILPKSKPPGDLSHYLAQPSTRDVPGSPGRPH